MNEKGNRYFRTGDLNLAAACMAVGVPLWQQKPVTVTLSESMPDRGSWNLCAATIDGDESVATLSAWWTNPKSARRDHPFALLMEFISARPTECSGVASWLDHAHAWLARRGLRPINAPRNLAGIKDFVARFNNSKAGYVFAFVWNRQTCLDLYHRANPEIELRRGGRMTRVGVNLDKRQAANLIARING